MKYRNNIILIILLFILLAPIGIFVGNSIFKINNKDRIDFNSYQQKKWKYNISNFNEKYDSYITIANWAKLNCDKYLKDGEFIEINVNNGNPFFRSVLISNGKYVNNDKIVLPALTDIQKKHIHAINQSFNTSSSSLDSILLYSDRIYFKRLESEYETQAYCVAYMFKHTEPSQDFLFYDKKLSNISYKKIRQDWYHITEKPLY